MQGLIERVENRLGRHVALSGELLVINRGWLDAQRLIGHDREPRNRIADAVLELGQRVQAAAQLAGVSPGLLGLNGATQCGWYLLRR